ncbi:MAG: MBL fold metallo-hydrolase [Elainellaceae cyanobacterium]
MYLTYFGANSWLLDWNTLRILIDPWLVGSLVFGNQDWLFKGDRQEPIEPLPDNIDLILLSQGLEDHAHRPTLEKLDRTIPVVGSPNAVKVVEQLGYQHITELAPGHAFTFNAELEIHAFSGAPIGLQVENGYLLKHLGQGTTLYYEPHGFPPSQVDQFAPVDIVISPVVNLELPLVGPIIKGHRSAPELATLLTPKAFFPTAAGGDVNYSGALMSFLKTVGDIDAFRSTLSQRHLATQVIDPMPREPVEVTVESKA